MPSQDAGALSCEVVGELSSSVAIYRTAGNFWERGVATGDFDGDGRADLVVNAQKIPDTGAVLDELRFVSSRLEALPPVPGAGIVSSVSLAQGPDILLVETASAGIVVPRLRSYALGGSWAQTGTATCARGGYGLARAGVGRFVRFGELGAEVWAVAAEGPVHLQTFLSSPTYFAGRTDLTGAFVALGADGELHAFAERAGRLVETSSIQLPPASFVALASHQGRELVVVASNVEQSPALVQVIELAAGTLGIIQSATVAGSVRSVVVVDLPQLGSAMPVVALDGCCSLVMTSLGAQELQPVMLVGGHRGNAELLTADWDGDARKDLIVVEGFGGSGGRVTAALTSNGFPLSSAHGTTLGGGSPAVAVLRGRVAYAAVSLLSTDRTELVSLEAPAPRVVSQLNVIGRSQAIAAVDRDQDGQDDQLFLGFRDDQALRSVKVMDGHLFGLQTVSTFDRSIYRLSTSDLDADGQLDLVVSLDGVENALGIEYLRNGRVDREVRLPVGRNPTGTVVGDLDGQPGLDMAVALFGEPRVAVVYAASASQPTIERYDLGAAGDAGAAAGMDVAAIDVDLDGRLDLVVADYRNGWLRILLRVGDGFVATRFIDLEPYLFSQGPPRPRRLSIKGNPLCDSSTVLVGNEPGTILELDVRSESVRVRQAIDVGPGTTDLVPFSTTSGLSWVAAQLEGTLYVLPSR